MIIVTELGQNILSPIAAEVTPAFKGAIGALAVMTVLSTVIGPALPKILPKQYTHLASRLFAFAKLLMEATKCTRRERRC